MSFHAEDEQIQELKNFCIKYKKIIIPLLLIAVVTASSIFGFKKVTKRYNNSASSIYLQIMDATSKTELTDEFKNNVAKLQNEYSKTEYASLASFLYAKKLVTSNDLDSAKQQLNWIINNSKQESIKIIAKQRIARILISESTDGADQALKLLDTISIPNSFDTSTFTLMGDAYYRKGDLENANLSYQRAKTLSGNNGTNILLQRKIENSTIAGN
jgi:predicted negative regulator of RcsB-dependent stress response